MKLNLTKLLYYYYKLTYGLIYFSNVHLSVGNIFLAMTILSYLLSSTLFIISTFNYLDIMLTSLDTVKYLEGLDVPLELIDAEHGSRAGDKGHIKNMIFKFFDLFDVNRGGYDVFNSLPEGLRNHYYMNNMPKPTCVATDPSLFNIGKVGSLNAEVNNFSSSETVSTHSSSGTINYDKYYYKSSAYNQKVLLNVETLSEVLNELKLINDNILSNVKDI